MRNCRICGDLFQTKEQSLCSKCRVVTQSGQDPVDVCLAHAEKFPDKREHYLARAEIMLVEVLRHSDEPQQEIMRRSKVLDFRQDIKSCQVRDGSRGKSTKIYRCPQCGAALASRSCLVCEMEIKRLLK